MKLCCGLCICHLAAFAAAGGEGFVEWSKTQVRGGVAPIFLSTNPEPAAVIRVGKAGPDYRRVGFLRIGLLPMAVAEGVTIELRNPAEVNQALARARDWFQPPRDSRAAELRRVVFKFSDGGPASELHAARVRFPGKEEWQLLDDVTVHTTNFILRASGGTLWVAGERAGRIRCNTARGIAELNVFKP